ncbi:MAG: 3-oxoacyl-ACP synthase, partial [Spirochaetia bacterium]|nr:3-oxoacyl-ACP synthase [Spirochaetia bacterium]
MKPPHSIQITAVGAYAPSKVITNDEMAELVDTSDEWIKSHTGIAERHIAEKGELTSDLAYKAIEDLFKRSGR